MVAASGNGGSWPSRTRSSGRSTEPVTVADAGSRPAIARSSVVLPTPFSPTRPMRRPGWASRSMPVEDGAGGVRDGEVADDEGLE